MRSLVACAALSCVTACNNEPLVIEYPADLAADDTAVAPNDFAVADFAIADFATADFAAADLAPEDGGDIPTGVTQGACHGCAWRGGRVFCWGANDFGQLGDGTTTTRTTAVAVSGLSDAVQVAVGCGNPDIGGHTCAVDAAGGVWCWGSNSGGELGDGTNTAHSTPGAVSGLPAIAEVRVGPFYTLARARDGRVYSWGDNSLGQLADPSAPSRNSPGQAPGISDAVEIAAGYWHGCWRHATGAVSCWGRNAFGEVGNGTSIFTPTPTDVPGISDAIQIVCGPQHSCVRRAVGGAWCWGYREYGQIGNGGLSYPREQYKPAQVLLPFAPVELSTTIATCARDALGSVWCWGVQVTNTSAAVTMLFTPTQLTPLPDAVALGGSCAARPQGRVSCWNFNDSGQVGDGTMTARPAPTDVVGLSW